MKIGKLALILDTKNTERIKKVKEENSEIPFQIEIDQDCIIVGLSPTPRNSIIIRQPSAYISRSHCELYHEKILTHDKWYIMDTSSNGTYLNSDRLPYGTKKELSEGDKIVFGDFETSALRYIFVVSSQKDSKKREFSGFPSININEKKKKSHSSTETTFSSTSFESRSDSEMSEQLLTLLDSSILENDEFLCFLCKKLALFSVYFKCFHSFCFKCYCDKLEDQVFLCPACKTEIAKDFFPLKNMLLDQSIKKRIVDPLAIRIYLILEARHNNQYSIEHVRFRDRLNAQHSLKLEEKLPIYSSLWTSDMEREFKEDFSKLDEESKLKELDGKGLNSEFLKKAKEFEINLILQRLSLDEDSQSMDLSQKKKMLKKFIRK